MLELTATRERTVGHAAEGALDAWRRPSVRLTMLVAALTCLGVVIVASAAAGPSFAAATAKRAVLTALGVVVFLMAREVPYHWWRRHHLAVLALALAALVAALVPGIGVQMNGARRWVRTGLPVGFQPSEFAKVALCIWTAAYCERNAARMRSAVRGFLAPLAVVGVACALVLVEPDFGTAVLTGCVCLAVLLVFGTRPVYVLLAAAAGTPLLKKLVLDVPYRAQRVMTFLNPWNDPKGSGYQLIQSKIAIGSGGVFGRGLGAGLQKAGFLPGADNDFIFSIVAEELGLVGCLAVIALFLVLLWECLKVILRARDAFAFGLATGLSLLLGVQTAAHIAVATGSVPTKGLSLPFISAGGSSLLASMLAAGILVSIARSEEDPGRHPVPAWTEDVPEYERLARAAAHGAWEAGARSIRNASR